jgi:NAD(P)-dependent dehydrogenase (short-subunit alcohol dehydrogenase family)
MPDRHVALVTGAGRGIGRAIALRLARAGAGVLVAARSQEACLDVCAEIQAEAGVAWPLYLDVADPDSIAEALVEARETTADIGPIDWLVNNAGIAESARFLDHQRASGVDVYEKHMRVNFEGPRRLIEELTPAMVERGYGRIVNVASSAGLRGYAYAAAYAASKHALVGYSLSAALELAQTGVTLNLVAPHFVDSPMTDVSIARIVKKTKRPARRAEPGRHARRRGRGRGRRS